MDPAKAFYGKKHVEKACAAQAVETLLISDKLFRWFYCPATYFNINFILFYNIFLVLLSFPTIVFRCQDVALRKEYVELVENVKDSGGDVKIFSSLHVSGERKSYINNIR